MSGPTSEMVGTVLGFSGAVEMTGAAAVAPPQTPPLEQVRPSAVELHTLSLGGHTTWMRRRTTLALLPAASDTSYVMTKGLAGSEGMEVSNSVSPERATEAVTSLSTSSAAVTPGSVKVEPAVMLTSRPEVPLAVWKAEPVPRMVITGGVVSRVSVGGLYAVAAASAASLRALGSQLPEKEQFLVAAHILSGGVQGSTTVTVRVTGVARRPALSVAE